MRPSRNGVGQARLAVLIVPVLASWLGLPVKAEEGEPDEGRVYAVQDRAYRMNHEFSFSVGFLPLDAFYKQFAVSGHYTVHFNDLWAWEAVHFSFSKYLYIDTGLKREMGDFWDIQPTKPEEGKIDYFLDTNLMIKLLYGKLALLDDLVLHLETYLLLGLGTVRPEAAIPFPLAVDAGAGMRIFFSNRLSLRLEVREYTLIQIEGGGVDNLLQFAVGFSYNAFAEERQMKEMKK